MATTGDHLGNLELVYIDDVAIGCTTQMSFSNSSEQIDATCKDNDGARQSLPGQKNSSLSISGNQVFNNTISNDDLWALWNDRTEFTCTRSTGVVGDYEYVGIAYIESIEMVDNVNEVASFSCSIVFTGAVAQNLLT